MRVKHLSSYCESVGARLSPDTLCAAWVKLFASNEHTQIYLPPSEGEIVIANIVFKYRNPFGWPVVKNKLEKSSRAFLKKKDNGLRFSNAIIVRNSQHYVFYEFVYVSYNPELFIKCYIL